MTTCFIRTENYIDFLDNKDFWFYALDSIGTSFYYPASEDGSVESMAEFMSHHAEKYGKTFYLGECGCCSVENASKLPYF